MRKIQIKNNFLKHDSLEAKNSLIECRRVKHILESGEEIYRGCGMPGLYRTDVGWRCFYCGNYLYEKRPSLEALWFHFWVGRDYWRILVSQEKVYINGVPISGHPDALPRRLLSDLLEPDPPKWFPYFICYGRTEFNKYLEKYCNV